MIKTVLVFCVFMGGISEIHAEEVYNFYFERPPKKEKAENKTETMDLEPVSPKLENQSVEMPDEWSNQETSKKYYIRKKKESGDAASSTVTTKARTPKFDEKKWAVQLGVGQMFQVHYPSGVEFTQRTYALGGRYIINKYFDIRGELHLPNESPDGEYYVNQEVTSFKYQQVPNGNGGTSGESMTPYTYTHTTVVPIDKSSPEGSIGLGVTPIHISVFGKDIFEFGVDGGVMFGKRPEDFIGAPSSTSSVYLGTRFGVNFSSRFSLTYSYKRDTTYKNYYHSSLSMGYKW